MIAPLKKIIGREYYEPKSAPIGTGSVALSLECGHTERRKASQEPDYRARCLQCTYKEGTT